MGEIDKIAGGIPEDPNAPMGDYGKEQWVEMHYSFEGQITNVDETGELAANVQEILGQYSEFVIDDWEKSGLWIQVPKGNTGPIEIAMRKMQDGEYGPELAEYMGGYRLVELLPTEAPGSGGAPVDPGY